MSTCIIDVTDQTETHLHSHGSTEAIDSHNSNDQAQFNIQPIYHRLHPLDATGCSGMNTCTMIHSTGIHTRAMHPDHSTSIHSLPSSGSLYYDS